MVITKVGGSIILNLNAEEQNAIDYFIEKRGSGVLNEYFGHFMQTRIDTAKLEQRTEVMTVFNSLTEEEQEEFLSRQMT
jgi:hypothetical protein